MAKKRRPRNRIEVDSWEARWGFGPGWRVYLHLGPYEFASDEVNDKRAAQRRVAALQAVFSDPLPVDWNP